MSSKSKSQLSTVDNIFSLLREEKKTKSDGKEECDPPSLRKLAMTPTQGAVVKSVFRPGKTYRFRLIRRATLVAAGDGNMTLASAVLPSTMSEYSAFLAIFDECRLHSTKIHYVFLQPGSAPVALFSAFNPSLIGGSGAGTADDVSRIPGSKVFNTWNSIGTPGTANNEWRAAQPRVWSKVSADGTGTDPVGGVIGAWCHVLHSATSATANVATYLIECDYEFRCVS